MATRLISFPDWIKTGHSLDKSSVCTMEERIDLLACRNILQYIERSQIGYNSSITSAYGPRRVVYADYTASGKSLQFIEQYISSEVLPSYGNTHTTTSFTSRQSTHFREEARSLLKESTHCSEEDALIFVGTGCTGAIHKLVYCLSLDQLPDPPIVFVGPFEHHSNLLPWKELRAEVIRLRENEYGEVDIEDLSEKLKHYSKTGRQLIGALNAASNITGVLTDTDAFTTLLHRYGALAFWDYATAAPYVKVDMNPVHQKLAHKDAVYFSMHKFVGGPDSPGILIAKKSLFKNEIPQIPGGGTVEYVTQQKHCYHNDPEEREEGGTPSIVGAVRAGLAMQLKQAVGSQTITRLEEEMSGYVFSKWEVVEELEVVGPAADCVPRLPVFSFLVRHPPSGLFLHHNFVSALLNDLFGIQARGGCSCAGPYGQALLDIPEQLAMEVVLDSCSQTEKCERELTKPGMTRVSFPYFMDQEAVDYIVKAVIMVAKEGWKLLSQYTLDAESGAFMHRNAERYDQVKHLRDINYTSGAMAYEETNIFSENPPTLEEALEKAELVMEEAFEDLEEPPSRLLPERVERVRWFLLPHEAWEYGHGRTHPVTNVSFTPKCYRKRSTGRRSQQQWNKVQDISNFSHNKSFELHFVEVAGTDRQTGLTQNGRVLSQSTVEIHKATTSPQPHALSASCDDLNESARQETCSKRTKRTRNIRKKLKSIFKLK